MINKSVVENCLSGQECKNCLYCVADKESWDLIEEDIAERSCTIIDDLKMYYKVKSKRKIFEQKQKGDYITLSEPESMNMLARY